MFERERVNLDSSMKPFGNGRNRRVAVCRGSAGRDAPQTLCLTATTINSLSSAVNVVYLTLIFCQSRCPLADPSFTMSSSHHDHGPHVDTS